MYGGQRLTIAQCLLRTIPLYHTMVIKPGSKYTLKTPKENSIILDILFFLSIFLLNHSVTCTRIFSPVPLLTNQPENIRHIFWLQTSFFPLIHTHALQAGTSSFNKYIRWLTGGTLKKYLPYLGTTNLPVSFIDFNSQMRHTASDHS